MVYLNLGEHDKAIKDLDEAIRLDPFRPPSFANRAVFHAVVGREQKALNDVGRASELGFNGAILGSRIQEILDER